VSDRLLICGGRDFDDRAFVFGVLDMLAEEYVINTVIQGDCPTGADHLARMWAISRNHHYDRFPPDWDTHGRAAGPIRNQRMIDDGRPTMGVAFPGGRGTADMVRRLKAAGIKVHEASPTPSSARGEEV
jgi:hypothetical protein